MVMSQLHLHDATVIIQRHNDQEIATFKGQFEIKIP